MEMSKMKNNSIYRTRKVLFVGLLILLSTACADDAQFDVVINDGRVMDPETNFDAIRNVGVKDGKIVTITEEKITGKKTIDATGHVVAPGFIDTQTHGQSEYGNKLYLRDGVTTPMDLEIGSINIEKFYAEREGKWQTNYGTPVAQEMARMIVLDGMELTEPYTAQQLGALRAKSSEKDGVPDWAVTPSSMEQMNEITKILDEELRKGALGVGSTAGYMAKGLTTYEMFEAQKAAARYGRVTASHVRLLGNNTPPTEGTLGFDELFANAVALNAPLLASHNNNYGWWEVQEKLELARKQGYNMWGEHYPYTAGSTTIGAEFLKPEGLALLGVSYENMLDPATGKRFTQETFEKKAAEDPGYAIVLFLPPREGWLPEWLKLPHVTVAGDGMWTTDINGKDLKWDDSFEAFNGHPRTAGAHAKTLRLARELNIPLMHTLSQLSYWTALHLGDAGLESMKVRGRMQEGMVADITIFNPETVTENSDYEIGKNGLPSTGIPYVLVNGTIIVKDSKVLNGVYPGQPIRYTEENEGRFVPATRENWLKAYTIELDPDYGAEH